MNQELKESMTKLGINVDHVATVRQARKETFPDPVELALAAVRGGAEGITAHLREDRRHIQDADIFRLKDAISVPFNLEMAVHPEIVAIATRLSPAWCCLVPEKREELTTEGGLNIVAAEESVQTAISRLRGAGIRVSVFIEPDPEIIRLAANLGADAVEIHTGTYANAWKEGVRKPGSFPEAARHELKRIEEAAKAASQVGLIVNAGHGVDYENVIPLAKAFPFHEFNIGFSVVARALLVGMEKAVGEMKELMAGEPCAAY